MKKYSYGKIIGMSWNWMLQILFRPFSLKKWIMLGVIIALAGQMGGGFNFTFGDFGKIRDAVSRKSITAGETGQSDAPIAPGEKEKIAQPVVNTPSLPTFKPELPPLLKERQTVLIVVAIVSAIVMLLAIYMLLWMWIKSNFSFVFIDSIIRNDASLRVPFHRNKPQGNSYLRWNIMWGLIALLVLGMIIYMPIAEMIKAGIFKSKLPIDAQQILSILFKHAPALIMTVVLLFLVSFFTREFVLPIMYKKKIGIWKAWGVFLELIRKNVKEFLLYLLARIGLSILALAMIILFGVMGVLAFIIIGAILFFLGWAVLAVTPAPAKLVTSLALIIIGLPTIVFLGFLFGLIFIPIIIFFRILPINFLSGIDESLDLFAPKTTEELMEEGDDQKFRRPMRIVWFAALLPIVLIFGLLFAIAIPNFIKAREKALRTKEFDIRSIAPSKVTPPLLNISAPKPQGKVVKVSLKNGNLFDAEIENESEYNITFRIEGGTFTLPRSDILKIEGGE